MHRFGSHLELPAKATASGPLRGTVVMEFVELVTDPMRGRPARGGGIHRSWWIGG